MGPTPLPSEIQEIYFTLTAKIQFLHWSFLDMIHQKVWRALRKHGYLKRMPFREKEELGVWPQVYAFTCSQAITITISF